MTNEEVVAALKIISDTGKAKEISKEDLQSLIDYILVTPVEDEKTKKISYALTKKGRVMFKANSK